MKIGTHKGSGTFVWPLSAHSASPSHAHTGKRQNLEHKQMDWITCKGKTQTTDAVHIYTHARALSRTHTSTRSLHEQSSCSQWSWVRKHWLVKRHHLHNLCYCPPQRHTYTEMTPVYLFVVWQDVVVENKHFGYWVSIVGFRGNETFYLYKITQCIFVSFLIFFTTYMSIILHGYVKNCGMI